MIDVRPGWCALLGLVLGGACSKRDEGGVPAAHSAAPAATASAVPRCKAARPGAQFSLGVSAPAPGGGAAEDDEYLPFSIEIGRAVASDGGFLVSALRSESGATHAWLVLVSPLAEHGRAVDLGRVFGDVEPPLVAARGPSAILTVPDSNPNGRRLKLMKVDTTRPDAAPVRGGELEPRRGFQSHDLEIGASRALVVWDEQGKASEPSAIWAAGVDPATLAPDEPRRIGALVGETPRLVRRTGGFWLIFVEPGAGQAPAAGPAREQESDPLVDLGPRGLSLIGLDERGAPSGPKIALTEPGARVLSFDAAELAPGGVVVAWRDDPSGPGSERGQVYSAMIGADGAVEQHRFDAEELGAGTPSLVSGERPWLAFGGLGDVTRLAGVDVGARRIESPRPEPSLHAGDVLAASGSRLLLAHPRGKGVEFSVAECGKRQASP